MKNDFVTMKQAQEILGVSNYTIWKMAKEGRIKTYRSNIDRRQKLVRRSDLERLARVEAPEEDVSEGKAAA